MRAARLVISAAVLALAAAVSAAAPPKTTAADVFRLIERNYSGIRDYQVDVEVNADFDNPKVHISKSRSTIYFKRPDKVKVVAKEGFAVMPDTFPGDPVAAIKSEFNATYDGSTKIDGEPVHVLKLVPKVQQAQGTMKLYVEKRRGLILGTDMQAGNARMSTRWTYARIDGKYWLPSRIKVEMSGLVQPPRHDPDERRAPAAKPGKGSATVEFSNYRVNKGLPDSIFDRKKGSK